MEKFFNKHFLFSSYFTTGQLVSGNAFVSGAVGLRFKSRVGQIGHSVANGSPPLRHSSKGDVLPGRNDAEMGPGQLVTRFGVLQRV